MYRHQAIALLRLRERHLKTEPPSCLRENEGCVSELGLEEKDEDEEVDRDSLKNEKKLRMARPIPPPSLPLEVHEILLGAPLLLNSPSISV